MLNTCQLLRSYANGEYHHMPLGFMAVFKCIHYSISKRNNQIQPTSPPDKRPASLPAGQLHMYNCQHLFTYFYVLFSNYFQKIRTQIESTYEYKPATIAKNHLKAITICCFFFVLFCLKISLST